jgi:hypothetical protein
MKKFLYTSALLLVVVGVIFASEDPVIPRKRSVRIENVSSKIYYFAFEEEVGDFVLDGVGNNRVFYVKPGQAVSCVVPTASPSLFYEFDNPGYAETLTLPTNNIITIQFGDPYTDEATNYVQNVRWF